MNLNRLAKEKSPYLQQHAHNPVDWYPWCDEAFEIAKKLDKPIFLSIGYSTCHWCHVMERESFDDEEVAEVLNDVFVCIKVDREERPDIDAFYMKVCQMMTGSGGWPLTIIMTPDKKPFFAGTYFPKETRYNRIGIVDLALNVKNVWTNRRADVENSANSLIEYLKQKNDKSNIDYLSENYLEEAFQSLRFAFDKVYGGFGSAPKFPTPQNLLFLLDYFALKNEQTAMQMVEETLVKMRLGGIFDHIGFGFHRYSTDIKWLVPHFEKMLYDQAMLLYTYSKAYQITKNQFYLNVSNEIVEYVLRELLFENKAFYSSEDADSEGEEGKFYLFEYEELQKILGDEFELFSKVFNVQPSGNFEDFFGENVNKNILHLSKVIPELADELLISPKDLENKIDLWRKVIFDYREKREKPFKDKKIMTDWNGLMIAGLSAYYSVTKRRDILEILVNYLSFFKDHLLKGDGSIFHLYIDNQAKVDGFLDDYAFSIFGFIEVFESTMKSEFLEMAKSLLDVSIVKFWSDDENAFYFTSNDKCETAINTLEFFDGAVPSGNSVMFYVLNKFYLYSGITDYFEKAERLEKTFAKFADSNPSAYNFFNFGLQKKFSHNFEVVIVYPDENDDEFKKYKEFFEGKYFPNGTVIFFNPNYNNKLSNFLFWNDYKLVQDKATAYLCSNFSCSPPFTNFELFVKEFERKINAK
ncbi:MAG: thioredoxin domain-containing protein [Bacteroidota bacterium]